MNRWLLTIVMTALMGGCDEAPSIGQENRGITIVGSSPLKVVELKSVPSKGNEINTPGSIKSRLSFQKKIATVNPQDLLNNLELAWRVVPTDWSDLPSISTDYLEQFSPIRTEDRIKPPLPPGTTLSLEARWWAIFDFNGDNIADWIGLQIDNDNQSIMDIVCICTDVELDETIILHGIIPTPIEESQTAFFLGRESVQSSLQRRQKFDLDSNDINRLRETFGRIVFWNGERPQSLPRSKFDNHGRETEISVSCEKCVFFYIDYSWFKDYQLSQ